MSESRPRRAQYEARLERLSELRDRTLTSFPVRVWRNFSHSNGFLLSAGMSFYVLFAMFALLFVGFAGVGLWLGASDEAITMLVRLIDTYIPGIVGPSGIVSVADATEIANSTTGVLGVTGVVAVGIAVWTAVGAITFTRRAVRDLIGLPFDTRSYWLLKAGDFIVAALFGGAMLLGSALGWAGVWTLEQIFHLLGWSTGSAGFSVGVRTLSVVVAFALDSVALAALVRFLTGRALRWRYIWPGSLLGGGAMVSLQLGAGLLFAIAPGNPMLASFAAIVGLLLWCQWMAVVILMAASWIAVSAIDNDQPLERDDEAAARRAEDAALLLATQVKLRRAEDSLRSAPWHRRGAARRAVVEAQKTLRRAEAEVAADRPRPAIERDVRGRA